MTKYSFSLLPKWLLIGALMLAGCCCHDDDNDTDPVPVDPYNGHEYVDLGLPSGLKWATCNVGATKPEEYGDYFAWGDTVPYYSSQDPLTWKEGKSAGYVWSTYTWCKGSFNTLTKYCSKSAYGYNGFQDDKTTLDPEDDAARYQWGGSWHMPTLADWQELLDENNCKWDRIDAGNTEFGGIAGYKVTSQKDGYKDRFIFLPAAGFRNNTSLDDVGSNGLYLSSSLDTDSPYGAWFIGFRSSSVNSGCRNYGQSIRSVCP